jgi:benzoyl-CoA reductase/2-hydroxyglutaryl-CoA dehydratase subunit BcrC/BadD/HgdB
MAREQGRRIIGTSSAFVPEELVIAAEAIQVGLCDEATHTAVQAEGLLPKNIMELITAAYALNPDGSCRYNALCNLLISDSQCNSGQAQQTGNIERYVMDLRLIKNENTATLLRTEYEKLQKRLEALTGKTITADRLKAAIAIVNAKRLALQRLAGLRLHAEVPISGLDSLLINQIYYYEDPARFTRQINELCNELERRAREHISVFAKGTPRVLVAGCPSVISEWKIPAIVETSGGAVVGEESCIGERSSRYLVNPAGTSMEKLLEAVIERYFKLDTPIFSSNRERLEHILELADKYHSDGVILYGLQKCMPYSIEAVWIETALENRGMPTLRIETGYTRQDQGMLKSAIAEFIERIRE